MVEKIASDTMRMIEMQLEQDDGAGTFTMMSSKGQATLKMDGVSRYALELREKPDARPVAVIKSIDLKILYRLAGEILYRDPLQVGDEFGLELNQAERDCTVVAIKRTRARIEYEMPNAGMMGGWITVVRFRGEPYWMEGLYKDREGYRIY